MACPVGHVSPVPSLATTCTYCGAGTQVLTTDAECQVCASGFFRTNDPVPYECSLCPAGEWQDALGASFCLKCNHLGWCTGGKNCKKGHTGLACSECVKGWFFFQGSCFECKEGAQYYSLIVLGVSLCALIVFVIVFADKLEKFRRRSFNTKKSLRRMSGKDKKKRAAKLGAIVFLMSFIGYMQIQTLIVSVRVSWPKPITEFFIALGAMVNFDLFGMISPQCSVDLSFEQTWMIRLISPVCILVPLAGGIYYMSLGPGRADLANRAVSVVIQILHMMFVGTTLHSLQPFDCVEYAPAVLGPNSEVLVVMDRFPKIKCTFSEGVYFRMAITAVIGFILYTCAYFLFVTYTLYRVSALSERHKDYIRNPDDDDVIPGAETKKKYSYKLEDKGAVSESPALEEAMCKPRSSQSKRVSFQEDGEFEDLSSVENDDLDGRGDVHDGASAPPITLMHIVSITEAHETDTTDTAEGDRELFPMHASSPRHISQGRPVTESYNPPGAVDEEDASIEIAATVTEPPVGESEGTQANTKTADDDDEDEYQEIMNKLHPELRSYVRRYGLLFLPFSQRIWFWELFSMSNKLIMAMTATFFSTEPR